MSNLNPTAGFPLGLKRSIETRNKMSNAKLGENNPHFGKSHTEEARKKLSQVRGLIIFVYSLDLQLLETFTSSNAAAKHFICSDVTIMKYSRSQNIFKDEYILSLAPL
jgi:group I intron endonuclease